MIAYPSSFQKLIEIFEKLPGVGAKSAQRYAFKLLQTNKEEISEVIAALSDIQNIHTCKICGFLCEEDECLICKDETRDHSLITVVENAQDVIAIEKTEMYHGTYHILGGLISSGKGIFPDDIRIRELLERIDGNVKEVIIATSATMDGEMTALYLSKVLKKKEVLVTRLAHGLPMGSNLDYADELTLIKALNNRAPLKEEND